MGVSGADETEPVSVIEGDSVTLHTGLPEIQNDDTILWMFGPKGFVISQITRKNDFTSFFVTDDVRFEDRLQVDQKTGSLTIRNTRIRHSGQYKLSISRKETTTKIFSVTVSGAANETAGVKSVSMMEGESVTLKTDVEVKRDDLIVWRFGDKGILLAKIDVETNETSLNEADERFRVRLKLDHQTGSLTITNTRTEHSGLYELQIRGRESSQQFLLSVTAVPDPGLSPGGIAGIAVAVLLVLVVVGICFYCTISKLKEEVVFENKKVEEGEDLCLPTGVPELHKDDKIQWYYEDENNLIDETNKKTDESSRSSLNPQTGDLTINNIKTIHSGLYILKISSGRRTKYKRFIVTLTAERKSVVKGDVLLETGVEIQPGVLILWTFGLKNCLVARAESSRPTPYITKRFKNILELNPQTGSLTIKNNTDTEYGHYKLQIIKNEQTTFRRFIVLEPAETKSVAEGDDVLLKADVEIQTDDLIVWMFGAENCLVARADSTTADITEGFRNRLELDPQTGSLTIKNITNTEYGYYKLQIINEKQTTFRRFNVIKPVGCAVLKQRRLRDEYPNLHRSSLLIKILRSFNVQNMLSFFLLLFFMDGVCGAETEAVMEGDSVTLHTNLTDIRNDDTILWLFGPKDSVISQITRKRDLNSIYFTDDVRFRGRLQVDQNTGSLTIRNTRITHSGKYKLSISREKTTTEIFNVTVFGVDGKTDEVKSVSLSVKEGESVTLKTNVEVKRDDLIVWRFEGILLAKIDVETNKSSLNEADERFRDRLKTDHQTGSLTITNTRTTDTGLYELQIRGRESSQRFLLSVTAVPDPGLSPGGIAGIAVAVLLVLVVVVIYYRYTIYKLKKQVAKRKLVIKEDVPLKTGVEIQPGDLILWTFGLKNCLVARADSRTAYIYKRFRGRLELDKKTGSLTIKNNTDTEYGHYKLQIINTEQTTFRRFIVLAPAKKLEAKAKDVTLEPGVVIQPGDVILWMFGAKNCLVARAESSTAESRTAYIDERFRDILELDPQTGSLTIKNITNVEYGYYKLQIINEKQTTFRRFNVTVTDYPGEQANEYIPLMKQDKDYDVLVLQGI
ncbi:unnamed protein product [Leuciscus chuanchicus]